MVSCTSRDGQGVLNAATSGTATQVQLLLIRGYALNSFTTGDNPQDWQKGRRRLKLRFKPNGTEREKRAVDNHINISNFEPLEPRSRIVSIGGFGHRERKLTDKIICRNDR